MMALHHICNPYMRVTVNDLGAQLWSILGADGTQYLWQGDPAYWSDRALTIFPYVARLWQGRYVMDGSLHSMPIHGFAPSSRFILREKTDTRMVCELTDNEDTRECYPRRFSFRVVYALEGRQLSVTYEVENLNLKPMYFGLGGHPGFNVPLEEGKGFEDYRLRFGAACTPSRIGFSDDCFVNGEERPFPLDDERILPLRHDLFDEDAIVLRDSAREVTLESMDGTHGVTVAFPDMPYLGIWHWPKTDAPYICIEPWSSLPSAHGEIACFEQQRDLICLCSGKTYRNTWTIRIF